MKKTTLTPRRVDELAEKYMKAAAVAVGAKLDQEEMKDDLVKLVQKNGRMPDGAEKSLRLEGEKYQLTITFGQTTSVDGNVVDEIRAELADAHTPRLFNRLFHEETSYIIAPTAPMVLENVSKKVRELFANVLTRKPKEPALKVEKKK